MACRFHSALSSYSCRPTPTGPGWVHELKHDGYRLHFYVRDGRIKFYTMNGADWSKRYPRIVEEAARIKDHAIIDAGGLSRQ